MIDANDLLDVESELGRIVTELETSKDIGDVIIAVCNDFSLRKLITDEIIERTGYNRYDIHLDENNKNLPKILSEEKYNIRDSIVFVHGIEKAEPEIYRYLNFQRDIFYKLKQRVVLWCYAGFARSLLKYAADFWRFKGNTYEFDLKVERELHVAQYMLSKEIHYRDLDELNSRIKIFEYLLKEVKSDKEKAEMLRKIGMFYYLKGEYDSALYKYNQSLEVVKLLGDQHGITKTLYNIAMIHQDRGEYDTALNLYNQSLEIEKSLDDQQGIASTLHNIAMIHQDRGEYDTALNLYNQSLEIEKSLDDQQGIASTLHNIATIHQDKSGYDTALNLYNQSLEIEKSLGDQRGTAYTLNNIATIYQRRGEYDTALDLYNQSLEITKSLGDQRGIVLTTVQIGRLFLSTGRYKEALQNFMTASEIFEKLDSPNVMMALDYINAMKQELGEKRFNQYQKEIESHPPA
ncbi:MAG: tetratricopeptide repeat protein [Euryarchaeota archaeon]|nr:tetratricopeptide repeat protein [Euryarchaeota archaeon]